MKTLKILLLLSLPLFIEITVSCCRCDKSEESPYFNCGFDIKNLDKSSGELLVSTSDSIPKNNYGIQLIANRKEYTCENPSKPFPLINTALACRCEPKYSFNPSNSIRGITIYSMNEFDSTHPAGSDVTQYFKVLHNSQLKSIPDFIKDLQIFLNSDVNFEASKFNKEFINRVTHLSLKNFNLLDGNRLVQHTPLDYLIQDRFPVVSSVESEKIFIDILL